MSAIEQRCQNTKCRICLPGVLKPVLDLGKMPLSDGFLTKEQLAKPEKRYPLDVGFCQNCSLVQILETVPPEELFCDDYPYYASFSTSWLAHARASALDLIEQRKLDGNSLVIELASNDGYLLKNFVEHGIPVLGIDPAEGPAEAARKIGVETLCEFFTTELADKLVAEGKQADVICGNNVLAHVADTTGFVAGIAKLLKDDGVVVIEVPYLRDLIEHCEFDTIYHEHLCYFSVTALDHLFRSHGLFLNRVKRLASHGGSLRLFIEKTENRDASFTDLFESEQKDGMNDLSYYQNFGERVATIGRDLHALIRDLKDQGHQIVAYGAAAKGTIMLNYAGIDHTMVDYVMDMNVHKQGKTVPGVRIPIVSPDRLLEDQPPYCLLLVWNLKKEILKAQEEYRRRGGRFIVPIPTPEIIEPLDVSNAPSAG